MSSNLFGKEKKMDISRYQDHRDDLSGYSFLPFLRYGYTRFVVLELYTFNSGVNRQFCDNKIVKHIHMLKYFLNKENKHSEL